MHGPLSGKSPRLRDPETKQQQNSTEKIRGKSQKEKQQPRAGGGIGDCERSKTRRADQAFTSSCIRSPHSWRSFGFGFGFGLYEDTVVYAWGCGERQQEQMMACLLRLRSVWRPVVGSLEVENSQMSGSCRLTDGDPQHTFPLFTCRENTSLFLCVRLLFFKPFSNPN